MTTQQICSFEDLPYNLDEAEKILVNRALDKTNGNVSKAAELLGVHRVKIYRILAKAEHVE